MEDEATDGNADELLVPALPPPLLNDQGSGRPAGEDGGGSRNGGGGSRSSGSADGAEKEEDADEEAEEQSQPPPKKKAAARRKSRRPLPWEARIEELRFFRNLTGHCKVPWCYAANPSLASWVDNQRRQRKLKYEGKTSSLTDEREATLDEMGFWWGFGGGRRIPSFEDRIEELRRWREGRVGDDDGDDGTTFAPMAIMGGQDKKKANPEIKSLHEWARHQEVRFQEGKLSLEREAALRAVGLRLAPRDPSAANWNWQEGYSRLEAYKEKFGHCNVTGTEGGAEYEKLKVWVDRQRSKYSRRDDGGGGRKHLRKSTGTSSSDGGGGGAEGGGSGTPAPTPRTVSKLKDHEVADLRKIGFLFKKWDVMYDKLERWRAEHGPDEPLPHPNKNCKLDGDDPERELKAWIQLQRSNFRKWQTGKLSDNSELMNPERISKLLKIGVDLLPTSARRKPPENYLIERTLWRVKLDELRAYRDHFGNCDVPLDFALNRALGKWAKEQRVQYGLRKEGKPNALTDERLYGLLGVGFSFDKAQPPSSSSSTKDVGEATAAPSEAAVPAERSSSSSLAGKKRPRKSEKSAASKPVPAEVPGKNKKRRKKHSKDGEKRTPSAAAPAPAEVSAKKKRYCTWEERLEQCRTYREEHGHLSVRKDDKDLGDWAYRQRIAYGQKKMGKLSALTDEKERQLEELGFVWETTTATNAMTTKKSAAAEESTAKQQQMDEPHRKKRGALPTILVAPPGGGRAAKKAGTTGSKASGGTKESKKKRGGRPGKGAAAAQSNRPSEEEQSSGSEVNLI